MKRSIRLAPLTVALAVLLWACGSDNRRGLGPEEWATISSGQDRIAELETQVASLVTTVPVSASPRTAVAFSTSWTVTIETARLEQAVMVGTPSTGDEATIKAQGVFLAIDLLVTNATAEPINRFPWWQLRLRDSAGRTFTPHDDATSAYLDARTGVDRPDQYQPGVAYQEAVIFEIPPDASGLTLLSEDESLLVSLMPIGPSATPAPSS